MRTPFSSSRLFFSSGTTGPVTTVVPVAAPALQHAGIFRNRQMRVQDVPLRVLAVKPVDAGCQAGIVTSDRIHPDHNGIRGVAQAVNVFTRRFP